MDDFSMEGKILQDALDKIASINKLLGGNGVTLNGIKKLVGKNPQQKIRIVDVGCGNGDMLRMLADYGSKNNWNLELIGIDANAFTVNYAKSLSTEYSNISYRCEDVFDNDFANLKYDIVLCTLTLHHFTDSEIIKLMSVFQSNASIGIVVNDLHRNIVAYRSFQIICTLFGLNKMSREDGLVSILRGFKKEELMQYSKQLNLKKYSIRWKWAFRYQWVIATI
jgi:2-polyprenyl-3-methyl-5-hydroxy-6-metoxy-1,4-benzoquinol methylase